MRDLCEHIPIHQSANDDKFVHLPGLISTYIHEERLLTCALCCDGKSEGSMIVQITFLARAIISDRPLSALPLPEEKTLLDLSLSSSIKMDNAAF